MFNHVYVIIYEIRKENYKNRIFFEYFKNIINFYLYNMLT